MGKPLVSLRESTEDFNAGRCRLRTDVEVRIGDSVTRWKPEVDTEWPVLDEHGKFTYFLVMLRAGIAVGEGEPPPEALWGRGPRDVEVIANVFGVEPDARVWSKGSRYDKD